MCGLVENPKEEWPDLVVVRPHHFFAVWDEVLAPCDSVRTDHQQDSTLVALRLRDLLRQAQGLTEELALLAEHLASDALVHVNLKSVLFEETSEQAQQWPPY